jgi:hypothetical protein
MVKMAGAFLIPQFPALNPLNPVLIPLQVCFLVMGRWGGNCLEWVGRVEHLLLSLVFSLESGMFSGTR